MYFPVGWPKAINLAMPDDNATIVHICSDAVKILVAAMGHDFLGIWYANPIIPITFYKRNAQSLETFGRNKLIIWKPDSRELAVLTESGALLLYQIDFEANGSSILTQVDSPSANLKRDSAELFIRENIPRLSLHEVCGITLNATITTVCCISLSELLIATDRCELIRTQWSELRALTAEGSAKYESDDPDNGNGAPAGSAFVVINLRNIPFYVHQNSNLKTLPPIGPNSYIAALEYSPFIGGCAAVFNDRRAAFLIAAHLRFESQSIHGLWVSDLDDATVCSVNHKFRLMAYGRTNGDINVYAIEDTTGGLEFSHRLSVNDSVLPGSLGSVNELKWSPDGCVLVVAWHNGGISLWSTFGALLMSSLSWDFGLNVDLLNFNPLQVHRLEWSTEGYQLFMTCQREAALNEEGSGIGSTNVLQIGFVKSTLAMNPCMAQHSHVLLQGDDTLYLNQGNNLEKIYFGSKSVFPNNQNVEGQDLNAAMTSPITPEDESMEVKSSVDISSILSESKYWTVLQLPQTYASTNWPIRYSAIDEQGQHLAVAGRTGLAHYSMLTKKWKLFGNETQEKDFVVSGGLIWWKRFIIMGCYSLLDRIDEIRCYPEECKLDNEYGNKFQVRAPAISLNIFRDQLIVLTSDGIVSLFVLKRLDAYSLSVECSYEVDVKSICIHPACIVSLTVTNLRNDIAMKNNTVSATPVNDAAETIIANVCGRILMIQRDSRNSVINSLMASCLASCVEIFWLSNSAEKSPMRDCLWLYSGAHGMRVWLPILPPLNQQVRDIPQRLHTFMAKRIMLSFPLKLYPLAILFDNVVVLGVENETTLYMNGSDSHFALPFCLLERKSQVYIHKILRQLIKRNLGYSAWEIAKSCRALPYFSHSLELLLHEVLEEEATSKEPIPDALLPSILDFIREFPVYLQTIVQCARKTEIALWPYLFSVAGKPKDLFQQCLQSEELETAASYLIILQNLEPSIVSKQYATLLLDISLQNCKWELAKDLVRFLKAIDPNEIDSPRSSMTVNIKIAPPSQTQSQVNQNPEVFNLILGPIARERSFSTTVVNTIAGKEKKETKSTNMMASSTAGTVASAGNESSLSIAASNSTGQVVRRKSERSNSTKERKETFCIESILQRHARKLLQQCKIFHLGYMCAFLDFHLVSWLSQEADRTAKLDDYVLVLTTLHAELNLPAPVDPNSSSEEHSLPNCSSMEFHHPQFQRQFSWDNRFHSNNKQHRPSSQTSESGYFSLAQMDTPTSTSTNNGNNSNPPQIPSIKEHEEAPPCSNPLQEAMQRPHKATRSNSQISLDTARLRRMYSLHDDMMAAAGESVTPPGMMQFPMGLEYVNQGETRPVPRYLSDKISIKIRYLLQLFIEANCTDYALVLSILLQDAASIGRIINVVIRSEAMAACQRIDGALKRLTQWSFDRPCLYRSFMIHIQPHIYMLEQYLLKSSATVNCNVSGGSGKADDSGKMLMLGDVSAVDGSGTLSNSLSSLSFKDSAKTKNPPIGQLGNVWDTFSNESNDIARDSGELANASMMPNGKRSSKELIARNETGSCGIM